MELHGVTSCSCLVRRPGRERVEVGRLALRIAEPHLEGDSGAPTELILRRHEGHVESQHRRAGEDRDPLAQSIVIQRQPGPVHSGAEARVRLEEPPQRVSIGGAQLEPPHPQLGVRPGVQRRRSTPALKAELQLEGSPRQLEPIAGFCRAKRVTCPEDTKDRAPNRYSLAIQQGHRLEQVRIAHSESRSMARHWLKITTLRRCSAIRSRTRRGARAASAREHS
jgi:hypothetical protein